MQENNKKKLFGLLGIANKAGYIVFGADNLKNYYKKLYLIIKSDQSGKNLQKIAEDTQKLTNCEIITVSNEDLYSMTGLENCKVIGIRNKGISEEILKVLRGGYIV